MKLAGGKPHRFIEEERESRRRVPCSGQLETGQYGSPLEDSALSHQRSHCDLIQEVCKALAEKAPLGGEKDRPPPEGPDPSQAHEAGLIDVQ